MRTNIRIVLTHKRTGSYQVKEVVGSITPTVHSWLQDKDVQALIDAKHDDNLGTPKYTVVIRGE